MLGKKKTTKKYNFSIKLSCSLSELMEKYKIPQTYQNTTPIEDTEKIVMLSFSDEAKKLHKCMLSKIKFDIPSSFNCFWDRNPIGEDKIPIGCPIKYVPNVVSRTYFSEITKDEFVVKETICNGQVISKDIEYTTDVNNYYEVDGIFCSFNCCLAFIRDNKKNPYYADSETLLFGLYNSIFKDSKIECAPNWRILKEYGGILSIDEFRKFDNVTYKDYGTYKPHFKHISQAFEEQIKF